MENESVTCTRDDIGMPNSARSVALSVNYGNLLCIPADAMPNEARAAEIAWAVTVGSKTADLVLLHVYPAGDCDTIKADAPNMEHLASALYGSRECGYLPTDCRRAVLPNGQSLEF